MVPARSRRADGRLNFSWSLPPCEQHLWSAVLGLQGSAEFWSGDLPVSVTGAPYHAAMLGVDIARPMRTHTEVGRLVAAVISAEPHDEADWIEWKSDLDLGSHEGQGTLARHILGLANRDPDNALRAARGCGYVLVGVEPGACPGLVPIDPADLEPRIQPFLGEDGPTWQPLWVREGERHVLVVVVDPPAHGDPIHTLRRPFGKYDDGDVFVRRMGATHRANSTEIQRLVARTRNAAEAGRLDVELVSIEASKVMPLDCSPRVVNSWLDRQRSQLLQPLEEYLAAEAAEQDASEVEDDGPDEASRTIHPALGATFASSISRLAEQARLANEIVGRVRKPEDRSPAKYREQVESYLDRAAEVLEHVAADRHISEGVCRIELAVRNASDYPFRDVEVELYIPGEGVHATAELSNERLPRPPRPWGDRWVEPYSQLLGGTVVPPGITESLIRGIQPQYFGPTLDIENHGSATLIFPSVDLAPRSARALDEFNLIVPAGLAGRELAARWTARSTSVPGVVEGALVIEVTAEPIDAAELLDTQTDAKA